MAVPLAGYWSGCRARYFGPETNFGAFEDGAETWLPFGRDVKYEPAEDFNPEAIPDLGYQHPVENAIKAKLYKFTLTFKIQDPVWMPFVVGDGATFAITNAIKSFHTQIVISGPDATGTDVYHTYYGCKVNKCTIKVSFNGLWECTLEIFAKTCSIATSDPAEAWTDETAMTEVVSQFLHTSLYIDAGGAEAEDDGITDLTLTFDNKLVTVGCISGYEIKGLACGPKEYVGVMTEVVTSQTNTSRFKDQTPLATLRVHCSNWTSGNKNIWFHNVKFQGKFDPLSAGETITKAIPFRPIQTATQVPVTFS